ncbi:hypothetical protein ABZT48_05250 [Streptomyces avermitilis]|uniref:hypothetical protein n=1 Tax=Streptomyces avermitilis TaxID=33903 RepID=UPI0033B5C4F6
MDDSLSFESLLRGAGKAADKAMEDHGRGEYDEFALHGGVAVERLAKAVLVKKNPIYLVEMRNGNSDLLLYFGGHLEIEPEKVRTVGANEALKRLRRMGVLPPDPKLDLLIELRNGTAHTTVGDQAKALLPTLAENIEALLKAIQIPLHQFWERWTSTVNVVVDRHRNEVQRDVEIRIKLARHLFADRFKNLPAEIKERALQKEEDIVRGIKINSANGALALASTMPCPACDADARVELLPISEVPVGASLRPESLSCRLCGLNLNGREEIEAAGVGDNTFVVPPIVHLQWRADQPMEVDTDGLHAN